MSGGFFDFGKAIGGGGLDINKIERDAVRDVASMESALSRAKKERDEYNASQEIKQTLIDSGADESEASLVSTLFRAGKNPEQYSGYQMDQQTMGFRDNAEAAVVDGDMDLANRMISIAGNKPLVQNKVEGNTIINPYAADANARTTGVGESVIRANDARGANYGKPRAGAAPRAASDPIKNKLATEVISRYGRMMARDGADVAQLTAQRDKELAALGLGPLVAPGTEPGMVDIISGLNAGTMTEDQAAVGNDVPEMRVTKGGKSYVKINGQWFEE